MTNLDWFPTLLAIAGAKAPEGQAVRGRNLAPLFTGAPPPSGTMTSSRSTRRSTSRAPTCAATARVGGSSSATFSIPAATSIYDLRRDPEETTNLIARRSHRWVVAELDAKLRARMAEIEDPVLARATQE